MNKKRVQYIGQATPFHTKAGLRMLIRAMDHPLQRDAEILTSKVISQDLDTGEITTLNTVYYPVSLPALCTERDHVMRAANDDFWDNSDLLC